MGKTVDSAVVTLRYPIKLMAMFKDYEAIHHIQSLTASFFIRLNNYMFSFKLLRKFRRQSCEEIYVSTMSQKKYKKDKSIILSYTSM